MVTLALASIATATTELAIAEPGSPPMGALVTALGWTSLTILVHACLSRYRGRPLRATAVVLAAAFSAPLAMSAVRMIAVGRPGPLELALLASLRNLVLGLAATSNRASTTRLTALASLFLILCSSCLVEGAIVLGAIGLYSIVGGAWLALVYWRGLRLIDGRREPGRWPAAPMLTAFALVGVAAGMVALGPTRAAVALAGLMPSSGGTDWDDPDARGGVGDGENEVKGAERPESIGFADSDVYLDTDRPSLYDAFNDMYGEPSKPRKMDRMVALSNQNVAEQRERPAENLRAGRQFSAVRRGAKPGTQGKPAHREAGALLYVEGPTPLHIPLAAYDEFNGRDWTEAGRPRFHTRLVLERRKGPWFRVDGVEPRTDAGTVAHKIKIAGLDSSSLPAPGRLRVFRVGEVDRVDFFDWACDGLLKMEGRTIPSSTVVETEAGVVDPLALHSLVFRSHAQPGDPPLGRTASALLASWTQGATDDWEQVEAIVDGLRRFGVVDARFVAPQDCEDVVEHFARTSRGPDYLFATTAAAMLRASGFSARLVSGLYARPERYDPRTRHTPVRREDVHVWAEVRASDGAWIAVEPTPGYQLMKPPATTLATLRSRLVAACRRLAAHPAAIVSTLALLLAGLRLRREAADAAATLVWRAGLRGSSRRIVLRTMRLVERRARLGGSPRPSHATLRRWYGPMKLGCNFGPDLDQLLALAEWSLYAPEGSTPPRHAGLAPRDLCRLIVRSWTLGRFSRTRTNCEETST